MISTFGELKFELSRLPWSRVEPLIRPEAAFLLKTNPINPMWIELLNATKPHIIRDVTKQLLLGKKIIGNTAEFIELYNKLHGARKNIAGHAFLEQATLQDCADLFKQLPQDEVASFLLLEVVLNKIKNLEDFLFLINQLDEKKKQYCSDLVTNAQQPLHHFPWYNDLKRLILFQAIMGVGSLVPEGLSLQTANPFIKMRFNTVWNAIHSSQSTLISLDLIGTFHSAVQIEEKLQQHGAHQGIHAQWRGEDPHAFSYHFIKDGDRTHLVYVNRGLRAEDDSKNPAVKVFTFSNADSLRTATDHLLTALKTEDRATIATCMQEKLDAHLNPSLTTLLAKSDQKTGNCAIANANITWHMELASQLMKKTDPPCSFIEAYQRTKEDYKIMRMVDRAQVLSKILQYPLYSERMQNHAIAAFIEKISSKKYSESSNANITLLVDHLFRQAPDHVRQLLDKLVAKESPLPVNLLTRIEWAEAILNVSVKESTYSPTDEALLRERITELKESSEQIKLKMTAIEFSQVMKNLLNTSLSDVFIFDRISHFMKKTDGQVSNISIFVENLYTQDPEIAQKLLRRIINSTLDPSKKPFDEHRWSSTLLAALIRNKACSSTELDELRSGVLKVIQRSNPDAYESILKQRAMKESLEAMKAGKVDVEEAESTLSRRNNN